MFILHTRDNIEDAMTLLRETIVNIDQSTSNSLLSDISKVCSNKKFGLVSVCVSTSMQNLLVESEKMNEW